MINEDLYDIILMSVGDKRIRAYIILKELSGMMLTECKDYIDNKFVLFECVKKEIAIKIKKKFNEHGIIVWIIRSEEIENNLKDGEFYYGL